MNNYIKIIIITLTFIALFYSGVQAQSNSNKMEIGLNVSQYQKDFGLGVNLTSPYFIKSKFAIRAGTNFQWFENFNGKETEWKNYQNFQLGIRSRSPIINDKIYIYGEGGVILILTNRDVSSKKNGFGGYGLFGFELKPSQNFTYFIELGGVGSDATADKSLNKELYSNGFLTTVGFRVGL